MKISLSRKRSI